jgi:signal transduction histidine kinase
MTLGIDQQDLHYLPRLRETLVDDLYRRSTIPQLLLVPVLCLMYVALTSAIEQRPSIGWVFAAFALLMLPRMLIILGYERLRRRLPDPTTRMQVFAIGSAMVGLGLGTINVMAAPVVSVEQVAILALIAAGISSVSIVSMNPSLRSYFLCAVPSVGTVPILLLLGPDMQHRGIFLVLVIINLCSLVIMATYVHVKVCKGIVLRIKIDDANAQLQSEITERLAAERTLAERNQQLEALNERLAGTQSQLLQSEKMASIGQLAAGVAHEINNPIAFVRANLHSLDGYSRDMLAALDGLDGDAARSVDAQFLREDIPALLAESIEGVTRVEKIVKDLKEFSHLDEADWQKVDLHQGIDSTLNVAAHELKYKADVVREYGDLPAVECLPFQINQVLLNVLVNAAQAIEGRGRITITTGRDGDDVWIRIADTGKGIEPAHRKRIFEPFFTTKPVGVGTGLGLSVSYSIVRRHGGSIDVESEVGVGTAFTIRLPVVGKRPG